MSQQNLDAARRLYDARNRGDVEAVIAECHPDVELFPHLSSLGGVPVQGHDGLRRYLRSLADEWEEFRHEPVDFLAAGDAVVAFLHTHALGRGSGVKIDLDVAHLLTFEAGRCIKNVTYLNKAEAMKAAGLREQAISQETLATSFRRAMEAYSRGDYDAAVAGFDPAIEWSVHSSVLPDPTTYHGHEGVKRFWETSAEAISGMALEIEECRAVAPDRVLAIARAHGRGAGSGAPVASRRFAQVVDFRDGRVVRVRLYGGVGTALKAVGLRE